MPKNVKAILSNKKTLYKDFSIRHKDSYFSCLKKFVESGKSLLINEAILTQNICAEALKKAKSR